MFARMSLKNRMIMIGVLVLIGMLVQGIWSAWDQRNLTYSVRLENLKSLVNVARTQVLHYQALEKKGEMSGDEARSSAREALRNMRFQGDNYFFIYTYDGITILLPASPEKEGESRIDMKDSNGVLLIRDLINAGKSGGAFTAYDYPRPGDKMPYPKRAYAENVEGWNWIIGSGLYVDDIDNAFYRDLGRSGLVVLILAGCVFGLLFVISRSVLRQIGGEPTEAMIAMKKVAEGDLTVALRATHPDSLLGELDTLIRSLRMLIGDIFSEADRLGSTAQHIRRSSHTIAEASSRQASSTQDMAAAMEELTVSISHISDNANETERNAAEAVSGAETGSRQVEEATSNMRELSFAVGNAVERINGLNLRAQEVGNIALTIKDIADQTNLLALNAAIEAARAGDTGRGFAVVADEVRKLAERTTLATTEIGKTLAAIQGDTSSAAGAMENAATQAGQSMNAAASSADILKKIADGAQQSRSLVASVAEAAREQSSASTSLAQQVEQIAQTAETTSNEMNATAKAANELEQVAKSLHKSVTRFRC